MDAKPANPTVSREGKEWSPWEYGALIEMLDGNGTVDDAAALLGRTASACRQAWERLVRGAIAPPGDYAMRMGMVRARLARRGETADEGLAGRVVQEIQRLGPMLHVLLAVQLAEEFLTGDEIRAFVGAADYAEIARVAERLVARRHAYRIDLPPTETPPVGSPWVPEVVTGGLIFDMRV